MDDMGLGVEQDRKDLFWLVRQALYNDAECWTPSQVKRLRTIERRLT